MNPDLKKMILFEDQNILVLHKPAGIAVQDARSRVMDLESMVRNELAARGTAEPYAGIVHRLDLPVEGVVVLAKTKKAAASLSSQIQKGQMKKEYLTVTAGKPAAESGVLTDHLLKDGRTNSSAVVRKGTPGAKEAELTYTVLDNVEDKYLLKIDLKTGRHHQIRVQLSHAGMPILGDKKYGWIPDPGISTEGGLALCAFRLSFRHPADGTRRVFQVKPESPWFRFFETSPLLQGAE